MGRRFTDLGAKVLCYADGVSECNVPDEPLSSVIGSEDADKIELIAKRFLLRPYALCPANDFPQAVGDM